jgi:hypothetical protein
MRETIGAHGREALGEFLAHGFNSRKYAITAMMPKAMIATVIPVRSLLLLMVLKASENVSRSFIKKGSLKLANPGQKNSK